MNYLFVFRNFAIFGFKVLVIHQIYWFFFKRRISFLFTKLGQELNEMQEKRIFYYSIALFVLFDWMELLRNAKFSKQEKEKRDLLMVFTPFFDDLGDEYGMSASQIMDSFNNGEAKTNNSTELTLTQYIYKKFLSYNNLNKNLIAIHGSEVVKWENYGKDLGVIDDKSFRKLKDVILGKGGDSIVFYRASLDSELIANEEQAYFKLGSLLQFTNDIFDVYKDSQEGHQTMLTNAKDLRPIYDLYVELIDDMIQIFLSLNYPLNRVIKFLNRTMIILSRGLVCFDNLLECQLRNNNKFELLNLKREELICDMEKWSNIKKSISYCVIYHSKIKNSQKAK
jgi:hypothetical protein